MRLIKRFAAALTLLSVLSLPAYFVGCAQEPAPAPGPSASSSDESPSPDLGSGTAPEAGSTTGGGTATP